MTQLRTPSGRDRLRVVHLSFHRDVEEGPPAQLLEDWPTLLGVASALVRAGVETTIVQPSSHDQSIKRDGVTAQFVQTAQVSGGRVGRASGLHASPRLLERIASLEPDLLHVNGLQHPLAIHRLAAAFARTPVVVQDHASSAPRGLRRAVWRWATAPVAAVTFTVKEQAIPFRASHAFRRSMPVFEVLEGSSHFSPGDPDEARRAVGIHGDPCLLWTGHLDANKDPLMVLDAFERAVAGLPHARLWCCFGKAPLLQEVRARIDRSSLLSEKVTLVGRRPHAEMELYYRAADFFVQGSHHEGCGYSIIEALACGTPPLVTDIPSSRRLVGGAGSLTPVGDAAALSDAMVAWSRRDRATMRACARGRFERELSFDAIGSSLRSVYETVLRSR